MTSRQNSMVWWHMTPQQNYDAYPALVDKKYLEFWSIYRIPMHFINIKQIAHFLNSSLKLELHKFYGSGTLLKY